MAHEITITNNKPEIAYAGETPWHGLGTRFDDLMTSAEAFSAAGLDWTVEKRPAFHGTSEGFYPIPGEFALVRSDTERALGVVGEKYQPIQNAQAFDFMDTLLPEGGLRYEVAGSLYGGKQVWLLAKLPSQTIISHDDIVNHYLLFTNAHDGRKSATVGYTTVRVVCNNTLRIANPQYRFQIRHSGEITSKLDAAREVLGLAHAAFDDFNKKALALSFRETTREMVKQFKLALFGARAEDDLTKKAKQDWETIEDLRATGMGADMPGVRGTAWGLLNAVTEFVDHNKDRRPVAGKDQDEARLDMRTYGTGALMKDRAFDLLLATV